MADEEKREDSKTEEVKKHPLEDEFVSMFPYTPRTYIRNKLARMSNNPDAAAVTRLTEELLANPYPSVPVNELEDDREDDEDVEQWQELKLAEMRIIFPVLSPDWLMETLDNIADAFQAVGDLTVRLEEMERQFNRKVDEILSLSETEIANLPTLKAWMERKQLQRELDMWSTKITAQDMVDLYEDPAAYFLCQERKSESELYRSHSLARLMEEFPFHNVQQIKSIFKRKGFFFAPARRDLLLLPNTRPRKTRRPAKDVRFPGEPCVTFIKERRFCELEDEIAREVETRRMSREQLKMEARTAGLLEECPICIVPDCLPSDMIFCMAGHKFCKTCVITAAEGVLARGRGMVSCLGQCDSEVDVDQLQKVVKPNVLSKLMVIRQAEELKSAGLENLVSCPYCPYQTIMDNQDDKVMRCLNPECGRDSCRLCKHSSHIPYSCKEYKEDVLDATRRRVEEELTMSWVRQCWNCNVNIERTGGCHVMTCPKCFKKTCYACRKPISGHADDDQHRACGRIAFSNNNTLHQRELAKAEERVKSQLSEDNEKVLNDLFQPSTSKK